MNKNLPLIVSSLMAAQSGSAAIIINEVDSDTPGTDVAEFVELFNTDLLNPVDLSSQTLVFYNGSTDLSYFSIQLTGTIAAGGYYVVGNPGVANVNQTFDPGATGLLQNGQDAVALYNALVTAFPTSTPVTTVNLLSAVVYDTADADDAGLLILTPGQPQIDENAALSSSTVSIGRLPNGTGGALETTAFDLNTPTPGASNIAVPEPTTALTLFSGLGMLALLRRRPARA